MAPGHGLTDTEACPALAFACASTYPGRLPETGTCRGRAGPESAQDTARGARMALAVIGFRRANQTTGRQITAVVTQAGFLHKSSGALGMAGRLHCARDVNRFPSKPGGHPVQESVMLLRRLHESQQHTYSRVLIAPAAVRLYDGVDEASSAEVIEAFTGAAPSGLRPWKRRSARSTGRSASRSAPPRPPPAPGNAPSPATRAATSTCGS